MAEDIHAVRKKYYPTAAESADRKEDEKVKRIEAEKSSVRLKKININTPKHKKVSRSKPLVFVNAESVFTVNSVLIAEDF